MLRFLALWLCLVALPATAAAEWHLTPLAGATFFGKTSLVDIENAAGKVHPHLGAAVTLVGGGVLGVEALAVWMPGFFQTGDLNLVRKSRSVAVMGNAVLTTPRRWTEYSLRPFISGGVGVLHASSVDTANLIPVDANGLAFNIGGGAIGFLSARTGLRFDVRYYGTLQNLDEQAVSFGPVNLRYVTASIGVVLRR